MSEMSLGGRENHDRLVGNVTEELQAQNALQELNLSEEIIGTLAWAIVANIEYAFDVRWSPRWEGQPPKNPD
jgi:hypothetical protein